MFERCYRKRVLRRLLSSVLLAAFAVLITPPLGASADANAGAINPLQTASRTLLGAAALQKATLVGAPITEDRIIPPSTMLVTTKLFPVIDPQTNLPVSRDTIITTPSGVKASAGDYWDTVNSFEAFVNKRGQTLRGSKSFDFGRVRGSAQSELDATKIESPAASGGLVLPLKAVPSADVFEKLAPARIAPAALQVEIARPQPIGIATVNPVMKIDLPTAAPTSTPKPTPAPTHSPDPDPQTLPFGYKSEGHQPLNPLPAAVNAAGISAPEVSKPWSKSYGDKKLAAIQFSLGVSAQAEPTGPSFAAQANLTGYLFNQSDTLAKASATIDSSNASVDMEALGDTLLDQGGKLPYNASTVKQDTFFDISAEIPIWILTLTLEASAGGTAGAIFSASVVPPSLSAGSTAQGPHLTAVLTPFVTIQASFSASVGVGILFISVSVGVEADFTLAAIDLPIAFTSYYYLQGYHTGNSGLAVYACQPHFVYGLKAELTETFLAGKVSIFGKVCVIFCATVFKVAIINWTGAQATQPLVNLQGDVVAGPLYSDLPEYGYPLPSSSSGKALFSPDASSSPASNPLACNALLKSIGQVGFE